MKIAFIEPRQRETIIAHNAPMAAFVAANRARLPTWDNPSLGLLTAAALVPDDWEVRYISRYVEDIDYDEPFDVVATAGITCEADDIYRICGEFSSRGVYTVVGGIHASVAPEEVAMHADTVIVGEAEDSFRRFLRDHRDGTAERIYHPRQPARLSEAPVPRYDLLEDQYQNYPVETTRGCPLDCTFCSISKLYGKSYRHKDVSQVLEEVRFIMTIKKNPYIVFVDNNMFVNRKFSRQLIEELIPLGINWQAQTDVSVAEDPDFLKLLRRAGCRELFIGFESINPENIIDINKSQWKARKVAEYENAIRTIFDHGIRVFGAFIVGFDRDTPDDVEQLKEFVARNGVIGQFTVLTPMPGTEVYEAYRSSGRLRTDRSWRYYNFMDCVISHPNFTPEELERAVLELYEVAYSAENYGRIVRSLIEYEKKALKEQS